MSLAGINVLKDTLNATINVSSIQKPIDIVNALSTEFQLVFPNGYRVMGNANLVSVRQNRLVYRKKSQKKDWVTNFSC